MNVYDSDRMADVLADRGYQQTDDMSTADMILINTCHIREKASEKLFSELGRIKPLKENRAEDKDPLIIAIAGCVAQAEGEEIKRRSPIVDIVFGPQTYHRLPEMLERAERAALKKGNPRKSRKGVFDLEFPTESKFDFLPETKKKQGASSFVSIQEGCDKFCTFCCVPYTRGAELSRPAADIIAETQNLTNLDAREIILLGQNVNAYHGKGLNGNEWNLTDLIRGVAKLPQVERIRYTTSHPRDMTDDLLVLHGSEPKLMPYLHLPVQSGSDRILQTMNRKHTAKHYLSIIETLKKHRPDIALSSDFIVGFPGETDADFRATMELVEAVGYAQAYSFTYSVRPGTPGALMDDQIPEEVKSERLYELQTLLKAQQLRHNKSMIGRTLPILIEKPGREAGQMIGRTPYNQSVYFDYPSNSLGQTVDVAITDAGLNSLAGHYAADLGKETPIAC